MKASDLERVQKYVSSNLHIDRENLTSLEGCPKEVTGNFYCSYNDLTSLKDCPVKIANWFGCGDNQLTSFEYFPKFIGGACYISRNKFTSFKDIDKHIEFISNSLFAANMNITSGYSDLFGIDGLQELRMDRNKKVEEIVNKYLPTKDLIEFQDEMIKAGFENYL